MGHIINVDLRKGGGVPANFITGAIEVEPTAMHTSGTALVLPDPEKFGITNGAATLDLEPSPSGEDPAWGYKVTIRSNSGRAWAEYVSVPAGVGPTAYTALPRLTAGPSAPPLTTWHQIVEEANAAAAAAQEAAGLVGAPAGAAVVAAISPGGAAEATLNNAIDEKTVGVVARDRMAPGAVIPGGRRVSLAGDSITDGSGATSGIYAYRTILPRLVGNYLALITEEGIPGQRSDQITARIPAMIAGGAQAIVYMAGTNDASQSVPLATYQANVIQAYEYCFEAGIPFIVNTVPPVGKGSANDSRNALTRQYNMWLRFWAPSKGIPVAEVFGALADPTDGRLRTEFEAVTPDGTHPGNDGHYAIAAAVAPVLSSVVAKRPWPILAVGAGLLSNPLHNSANAYDGWTLLGTVGQSTTTDAAPVAGDNLPAGNWMKMAIDNTAGGSQINAIRKATIPAYNASTAPLGWSPGDTLAFFFHLKSSDPKGTGLKVQVSNQSNVAQSILFESPSSARPGPQMAQYTVPATGVTGLTFDFAIGVPAGKNIDSYLGASDVVNLTKLGITAPA